MKTPALPRACASLIIAGLAAGGSAALAAEGDRIVMTEVGWEGEPNGGIAVIDDTDDTTYPPDRRLTIPPQGDIDMGPSWSPTGKQLAFLRFSYEGNAIYRINVDGSGLRRLVGGTEIDSFGAPVWGPRSTNLIAFVDQNGPCINVMSPDGSNQRAVLCPKGEDGTPRATQGLQWFPDGKHLLVCTYWDGSVPANVQKVDLATGNTRLLASFAQCPVRVGISPNGRQLALENDKAVHVLDVATGTSRFLTAGTSPVFSADGRKVAFQKEVSNLFHPLFVIDTDGSNARQITPPRPDGAYSAYRPIEWSVDGSEVVVQATIDTGDDFFSYPSGIIRLDDGSFRAYLSSARAHGIGYPNPWFEREDAAIALTNCVTRQNLIGQQGRETLYKLAVPTGKAKLRIETSGGTGDVSLYASLGDAPSPDDAQRWSRHGGTNREAITIAPAPAGTYYIKVIGEVAYSGVNVRACYAP